MKKWFSKLTQFCYGNAGEICIEHEMMLYQ